MLLANGAILGHVASSLAHEPDGSALDGLGFTGANEDGIGRRHEPITVAFLWSRVRTAELVHARAICARLVCARSGKTFAMLKCSKQRNGYDRSSNKKRKSGVGGCGWDADDGLRGASGARRTASGAAVVSGGVWG